MGNDLQVITKTIGAVGNLVALMMLFMLIFAILGMGMMVRPTLEPLHPQPCTLTPAPSTPLSTFDPKPSTPLHPHSYSQLSTPNHPHPYTLNPELEPVNHPQ